MFRESVERLTAHEQRTQERLKELDVAADVAVAIPGEWTTVDSDPIGRDPLGLRGICKRSGSSWRCSSTLSGSPNRWAGEGTPTRVTVSWSGGLSVPARTTTAWRSSA